MCGIFGIVHLDGAPADVSMLAAMGAVTVHRGPDDEGAHASIDQLIADHQANRVDGTDRLLSLIALELWARIFLDRRSPADVTAELRAALA